MRAGGTEYEKQIKYIVGRVRVHFILASPNRRIHFDLIAVVSSSARTKDTRQGRSGDFYFPF